MGFLRRLFGLDKAKVKQGQVGIGNYIYPRPCLLQLREYTQYYGGCPEKLWDNKTNAGCPGWKEYILASSNNGEPIVIKECVVKLQERWLFEALKLSEGNQQATESFRNYVQQLNENPKPINVNKLIED